MNRKDIAYKEATRDPIFLFQERVVTLKAEYDTYVEWDSNIECLIHADTRKQLDDYDLVDNDWADITWRTTGVFSTREEGEAFGERTSYRYGPKGKNVDWKVYCIALERDSALAKLLNGLSENTWMDLLR